MREKGRTRVSDGLDAAALLADERKLELIYTKGRPNA